MPFFNQPVETLPREQLQAHQLRKVQLMLGEIYEQNRFYTAKLKDAGVTPQGIQSLDDFYQLPFTLKRELVQAQVDTQCPD